MTDPLSIPLNITGIERFAIHDGPGIRTTVFLQGCPLCCTWCSNPELRLSARHLMYMRNRCAGCGACAAACPDGFIAMKNGHPVFDRAKCRRCGSCERACLHDAIRFSGREMPVGQIVNEVLRDRDFYRNSGGGVTVSGGEAFTQFNGLTALLSACRDEGVHTAVETCGQTDLDHLLRAAPLIDLFLFDIKHTDPVKLKHHTGGDAEAIMANLKALAEHFPGKTVIRVPVIPSFNYDEAAVISIFELALAAGVGEVHLLPYHTLGVDKYSQMGLRYSGPSGPMLTKEDLEPLRKTGEEMGLTVGFG